MVRFGGDALLSPLVFSVVGATLLWVLASRSGSVVNIKAFLQSQGAGKVPHLYFNALGAVALIGALVFAAVWAAGVVVLSAASDRVGGMRIDVIEVETARPITTSTSAP